MRCGGGRKDGGYAEFNVCTYTSSARRSTKETISINTGNGEKNKNQKTKTKTGKRLMNSGMSWMLTGFSEANTNCGIKLQTLFDRFFMGYGDLRCVSK